MVDSPVMAAGAQTSSAGSETAVHTGAPNPLIHVAILGDMSPRPAVVEHLRAASEWCICEPVDLSGRATGSRLKGFDVSVLLDTGTGIPDKAEPWYVERARQLELLLRNRVGVLILTERPWLFAGCGAGAVCLPHTAPVEMVHGALLALSHSRPMMRAIDKELASMQRLNENLQKHFEEVDHDLRLASRLQREFLPHELPQVAPARFSTIFRPCGWVSGDIFDVFRLDEAHVGFYLADAVGHGVAAGLLTMYIKHAICTKRILRVGYELVSPSEVLAQLNDQLVAHALPDSQFITAWYGLLNTRTLELRYSIAGHPPPLRLDAGGTLSELRGHGCLLGIFANQEFAEDSLQLQHGDRVIVYSDGLENTLISHRPPRRALPELQTGIREMLRFPSDVLMAELTARLDTTPGGLQNADDVSAVILDIDTESQPESADESSHS